ncbi:fork head domain transcription factor slp1-like isoform X1 [Ostrinia furnacalis]|uniref:fork head domain transcription factor slp1-like isoform X1 n=1 Tax=Ostrinia furnacalis TaxID=93504 RepID=UPI00103B5B04|nr:fork head domain transcription factor slp1-like isoform X1 [Ostrinia furnacalis]
MSAPDRSKWRRRKSSKSPAEDDNDCASLAWLLNFRLDEFVNVKVPDDEPAKKEPKIMVPDGPPAPRKPLYTYPELIERALREKGELTVSAIYQWISDRFPYYKANDERWKNSVRHNLSINPHFRKGARAPQGAGHLWSLAANAIDLLPLRNCTFEEERTIEGAQEARIIACPKVIVLDEAAIAAASIIPDQDFFTGGTMFLNPVSTEQVVRECGLITAD